MRQKVNLEHPLSGMSPTKLIQSLMSDTVSIQSARGFPILVTGASSTSRVNSDALGAGPFLLFLLAPRRAGEAMGKERRRSPYGDRSADRWGRRRPFLGRRPKEPDLSRRLLRLPRSRRPRKSFLAMRPHIETHPRFYLTYLAGGVGQQQPSQNKGDAAKRRDGAQPSPACEGHDV